jgi:Outer membrane protein and related peptidoglycan-associated (lipo)proteins
MDRKGVLRRGGLLVLGMMGLALVMGGCSKDKKAAELAQAENAELRERIATLEESLRQKDAQLAQQQQQQPIGWETQPVQASNSGSGSMFSQNSSGLPQATIAGDVLFASGSADIKPEAKKTLDRIATEIKRDFPGATIRVEGYTDSDPLVRTKKKWGTNENLSQARADAVKNYLATRGVSSSRIETYGYGSAKPKATKAASRRVEIIVIQ